MEWLGTQAHITNGELLILVIVLGVMNGLISGLYHRWR